MTDGASLLVLLDASLGDDQGDVDPAWDSGLAAAVELNSLLLRHHLVWDDVAGSGSRLAKLCGRLGSDYQAERAAAYHHAVHLIRRRRTTWTALVLLPEALLTEARPTAAPPPPPGEAPPDENWIVTIRRLNVRAAWRSDAEHIFLESLEHGLAEGQFIGAAEARWVRDIWWEAELNNPEPEDALE